MTHQQIHARALEIADRYRKCVRELIEILQTVDGRKTYRNYECTSLYQYAVTHLKLSESVAMNFITVARKAVEVPAIKDDIESGAITLTHARKMCSVITAKNQDHWLGLSKTVSSKVLEREVAKVNPKASVTESTTYVSGDRIALRLGVSQEFIDRLKRVQDLESQRTRRAADKEAALSAAVEAYLEKHDPVRRAERITAKKAERGTATAKQATSEQATSEQATAEQVTAKPSKAAVQPVSRHVKPDPTTQRKPIPALILHQLNLRDSGRCTYKDIQGNRCDVRRWLERHHLNPVAKGGTNSLENLTTLCNRHHVIQHLSQDR